MSNTRNLHPEIQRRKELVQQWRKRTQELGRLYWRSSNRRWRHWPSGAIAMAKSSTSRMYFDNLQAIADYMNPPVEVRELPRRRGRF